VEAAQQRGHEARVIDVLRCYMNITSHRPSIHYKGEQLSGSTPSSRASAPR
jgi:ribosomal protein S6--L-glutamate ligase